MTRRVVVWAAVLAGLAGAGGAWAHSRPSGATAGHLYWSNGKIFEANPNGTHVKPIANRQQIPEGLAVGGGHLYWVKVPTING